MDARRVLTIASSLLLAALVLTMTIPAWADSYQDGIKAYKKGNYALALKHFRQGADLGDISAMYILGQMYREGQGLPQDTTLAVKWYRKAADQGFSQAQYNLAVLYTKGEGVPQDYNTAIQWYKKAAKQENPGALFDLGVIHAYGQGGIQQDLAKAVAWYRKAAELGHANAQHNLGLLYVKGEGVPQDYTQAFQLFIFAAGQGHVKAQVSLGNSYLHIKKYHDALKWYKIAAEQGQAIAQHNLGVMLTKVQAIGKDYVQAYKWLTLSTNQGFIKAAQYRDQVATEMTPAQIKQAEKLAREWKSQK